MTEKAVKQTITVTQIVSGDLWAGAEVQVFNLCKALHRSGEVAVTAIVFNPGILHDKLAELGIPVTLADERSTGPVRMARSIADHCRSQGTDIIHTHGFKENILGILGKELASVRYSIRTVHGNPEHHLSWNKPHKWLINRLDILLGRARQQAVIAVSSQLERALEPLFPGKVHKISNFIDVRELRNKWLPTPEKGVNEIRLGLVGRLVPVKRVDLFIHAIQLLNDEGTACKGVIIGDGPLRRELETLASDLGIQERVDFKGFIDPVAKEMRTLDMLVMTSDHEGLPMTLLEAMALSIPVVAHKTGGITELLDNGHCGVLVTDHTASGYAQAIKKLLQESSRTSTQDAVKEKALSRVNGDFSLAINSRKYLQLYQGIASKRAQHIQ